MQKVARGRVTVPTKLIRVSDRLWTPSEIEAAFSTDETQAAGTQPVRVLRTDAGVVIAVLGARLLIPLALATLDLW